MEFQQLTDARGWGIDEDGQNVQSIRSENGLVCF